MGTNFVSPRGLVSRLANQLVGIQGIVTKLGICRSQLEKSVQFSDKTKNYMAMVYSDLFNPEK